MTHLTISAPTWAVVVLAVALAFEALTSLAKTLIERSERKRKNNDN